MGRRVCRGFWAERLDRMDVREAVNFLHDLGDDRVAGREFLLYESCWIAVPSTVILTGPIWSYHGEVGEEGRRWSVCEMTCLTSHPLFGLICSV